MTPQLAERLTIHEVSAAEGVVGRRRARSAAGGVAGRPSRRLALLDQHDRQLPGVLRRAALQRRLLALADVAGAALAFWLVLMLPGGAGQPPALLLAASPLLVLVCKLAGLYDREQLRMTRSTLDDAPALIQLTGLYVLGVTIAQSVLFGGALGGDQIAALWLASFLGVAGARMVARWSTGRAVPLERCLVIGDPEQAERLRDKLRGSEARAVVVATFPLVGTDDLDPLDPASVRAMVDDLGAHRIVIAPGAGDSGGLVELIRIAKHTGVQVSVLPRMLEVLGTAVEFDDVDGMTMLGVRPFGLSRSSRLLKRGFDLTVTVLGLLAVAPLIAALAAAIRLDTRGPVFFRQVRVGRDGREFRIYKFRSMVVDADARKDDLRGFNEVGTGMFKMTEDPRVTRVGRLLRRTSLDELPQLLNVLRGEMSLVGPRPLVVDEDAQVVGLDRSRLHLTPGMTGPWQVLGSRVPMQEMVGIDYLYVAGWSLWLDVKLLVRTARHVLRCGNV